MSASSCVYTSLIRLFSLTWSLFAFQYVFANSPCCIPMQPITSRQHTKRAPKHKFIVDITCSIGILIYPHPMTLVYTQRKRGFRWGTGTSGSTPPPLCASTGAVPKNRAKQRFNAHPVLRQDRACVWHTYMTAHIQESPLIQIVIGWGRGISGMAKNHIKTNISGLQCVVEYF